MTRTSIDSIPNLPESLREFTQNAPLFDSSCSPEARVWFADRDNGFYIKTAPKGALKTEADMTAFFHSRNLGTEVLAYEQLDADWLVTRAVPGEDCLHSKYLADPKRLSETTALLLRQLHDTNPSGCPVPNRSETYVAAALRNHDAGIASAKAHGFQNTAEAWAIVRANLDCLDSQVLVHGDYCLPNIMLDRWNFSGFIDVGNGGVGDKHIDLYWGVWSLMYNLKDQRWCTRFLDAYGREDVEPEKLRILAAFEVFG